MKVDANTQLNLVIGNPIQHSQSPSLHQIMYDALNINATMLAIENPSLPDLIQSIRTLNIALTAVTLPFKTEILHYVDTQSEAVTALQAANTLIYKNGKIHAENTDIDGIKFALSNVSCDEKNILIIGAGGAARAVGYVLQKSNLYWLNRTKDNAKKLAEQWGGKIVSENDLPNLHIDIIINATSIGMSPNIHETPLPGYAFQSHQTVFDLIYNPQKTRLLQDGEKAGSHCISGINMFIAQAIKQVEMLP